MVTDTQVRNAIAQILKTAVPDALVFNRWIGSLKESQWAAQLMPEEGTYQGRIHGWMVQRRQMETRRPGPGNRFDHEWTYAVWGFRQYDIGTDGTTPVDDDNNSEDSFSEEVTTVSEAFALSPQLGLIGPGDGVHAHDEFQVGMMATLPFSGQLAHVAQGFLTLRLYQQL